MKQSTVFTLVGAGLGLFVGSSMGVAAGGTAYNAALFLTPTGAFVGWLLASNNAAISDGINGAQRKSPNQAKPELNDSLDSRHEPIETLVFPILVIMASIWHFHIEILRSIGLLPTFVRQPVLFVGFGLVVTIFFPPFIAVYFLAWLGASHFGLSKENQYRATVR